jgi:hypothetical protein
VLPPPPLLHSPLNRSGDITDHIFVLDCCREAGLTEDVLTANGFEGALEKLNSPEVAKELGEVFVIGGGSIYEIALRSDSCSKIYMTTVQQDFECDTFMPSLAAHGFVKTEKEVESHTDEKSGVKYTMDIFRPKHAEPAVNPKASLAGLAAPRHEEYQYLDLIQVPPPY